MLLYNVTLGYLKEDGNYNQKLFKDDYELLSLKGSIAGNKVVHMHASMDNDKYQVTGGHFFDATVAGVVEIFITIVSN